MRTMAKSIVTSQKGPILEYFTLNFRNIYKRRLKNKGAC